MCLSSSIVYQDPLKEFWDQVKTANELDTREYFGIQNSWPECLKCSFENRKNSFSAFGSLVCYLRVLKLDYELLSYGDVNFYEIMEEANSMIVDGQAIEHLSVCTSGQDQKNTLLGIIDRCCTAFGHRRLRLWLMHPLLNSFEIKLRQESITYLVDNGDVMSEIVRCLKSLPDLERLCTRIHAGTLPIKFFVSVLNGFKMILVKPCAFIMSSQF
jgi:DNA mismatch repair protein MSH6